MKRISLKLSITRQTLRPLDAAAVRGGAGPQSNNPCGSHARTCGNAKSICECTDW